MLSSQLNQLVQQRKNWNKRFSNKVPSEAGKPTNFAHHQPDLPFLFDRPLENVATILVTLHHPIFSNFLDDCDAYQPTAEDSASALDFSQKMSGFFDKEALRTKCALELLTKYGLLVRGGSLGELTTNGDLCENNFVYAILETELELGASSAEPVLQLGWYYAASMNEKNEKHPRSNLPCLLIYLVGEYCGSSLGMILTTEQGPILAFWVLYGQAPLLFKCLAPVLPLYYHYSDWSSRDRVSRAFGALKKACSALKDYYGKDLATLEWPVAGFPHPHEYKTSVGSLSFTYLEAIDKDKLIFHAKCDNEDICINFVRRYSREAHETCVSIGCAPALRGFECIPGGWFMVVMDYIGESHCSLEMVTPSTELEQTLVEKLGQLHQEGYVHGDIRVNNNMVPYNGKGIMLLDFDWGGKIGKVTYPININLNIEEGQPDRVSRGEYTVFYMTSS